MTLLSSRSAGPFSLRVVDATANIKGWEHSMSQELHQALSTRGIPLSGALEQPADMRGVLEALAAAPDYNALLLVTHGTAPDDSSAAHVRLADQLVAWELLGETNNSLSNKAIFLAICFGANPDARFALGTDGHQALAIVGSQTSLTRQEVLDFFPEFLEELSEQQQSGLSRDVIELVVGEHSPRSNHKMTVLA